MAVVFLDSTFPAHFDLADGWPTSKGFWRGGRYVGPGISDLSHSATWATEEVKTGQKGRPAHRVRDAFAREWITVSDPPVHVNRRHLDRLLTREQFNAEVRPFSDVDDTSRLLTRRFSGRAEGLDYLPGKPEGVVLDGGRRVLNTFRPGGVAPAESWRPEDAEPFLDFMRHLIPDEAERLEVLRWVATLIARPAT